jgi:hypothetical protein
MDNSPLFIYIKEFKNLGREREREREIIVFVPHGS